MTDSREAAQTDAGLAHPGPASEAFSQDYPSYALLFAWNHAEEIMAKEQDFRKAGGRWIRYVPRRARGLTGAASSAVAGTRVVVLGGSGFIGSAVVARFVAAGAVVRSVSRSGRPPVAGVEAVAADLTEPGRVAEVVADADGCCPSCCTRVAAPTAWMAVRRKRRRG